MQVKNAKFDSKAISEYCRTHSTSEAARHFQCSLATAINACTTHGVQSLSATEVFRKKVAQWVQENNASLKDAARHFNATPNRVRAACNAYGVTPRTEIPNHKAPVARSTFEILALLIQGYGPTSIAEEFCVAKQRISQIKTNALAAGLLGDHAIIQLKESENLSQEVDSKPAAG